MPSHTRATSFPVWCRRANPSAPDLTCPEDSMSWLDRVFGRRAAPMRLHGVTIELQNSRPDINDATVLERLDEALGLIARYAPERLRHLQRDVKGIRVMRFPTRGAYFPDERIILTELTFLARRDMPASPVASSILHESVHARVHAFRRRMGGHSSAPEDMAREERLCRRAELAFGRALPPDLGAPVVERAMASLAMQDADVAPVVDWTLAAERQRAVDEGNTH